MILVGAKMLVNSIHIVFCQSLEMGLIWCLIHHLQVSLLPKSNVNLSILAIKFRLKYSFQLWNIVQVLFLSLKYKLFCFHPWKLKMFYIHSSVCSIKFFADVFNGRDRKEPGWYIRDKNRTQNIFFSSLKHSLGSMFKHKVCIPLDTGKT